MKSHFEFLDKKDQSFPATNAGKRTLDWAKEHGVKVQNRADIWRAYMMRLESVFVEKEVVGGSEHNDSRKKESSTSRALRLFTYKILKNNTIDLDNEEEVAKIAQGLFESEKKRAIELGHGSQVENLDEEDTLQRYKESIVEKKEIQSQTLSMWVEYITGPDCTLPTWFKYHSIRSLLSMGTKNEPKSDYNKRASTTVSPYPEFNSEALGWVYKALSKELHAEDVAHQVIGAKEEAGEVLTDEEKQNEAARINEIMSSDKFSKLFYFANLEVKGNLDRSFVEGAWVKYEQGSDYTLLEDALRMKGTGWCTAEGSAAGQIQSGDFYVYYSKNGKTGAYTEPRVAIRMQGDSQIGEVRGVNSRQELEPQFTDILDAKMNDFGEQEAWQYKKKSADMKQLTFICKKNDMGEQLSGEEVRFLYEVDGAIEGFGYDKDPRIKELRDKRNLKEDLPLIFNCEPTQIATNIQEISPETKAYIGPWSVAAHHALPATVEHVYNQTLENKVFRRTIELTTRTNEEYLQALSAAGMEIYDVAKNTILPTLTPLAQKESVNLVSFSVSDLGFPGGATLEQIYANADELGLDLCDPHVGPEMRLAFKGQSVKSYYRIAMKPVVDTAGYQLVWDVSRHGDAPYLDNDFGPPGFRWGAGFVFVFASRKN